MKRPEVAGLDTLRFAAAMFVVLSHGAQFPVSAYFDKSTALAHYLIGLYDGAFNGVAAVLVFFTISGFCIHYNFACGAPFKTGPFLIRRLLRVSIPLVVAVILTRIIGPQASGALQAVLWSLYCELIYYLVYPGLRRFLGQKRTLSIIFASFLVSVLLIAAGWSNGFYWQYPIYLMWLVAWPAWLLGCLLAEVIAAGRDIGVPGSVWSWRVGAWCYSVGALLFYFHGWPKIGYPLLLTPFSLIVFVWLYKEIDHARRYGASTVLEWFGTWSYSLYLVHNPTLVIMQGIARDPLITWLSSVLAVFSGALLFYHLVKSPSHRFARFAARRFAAYALPAFRASTS